MIIEFVDARKGLRSKHSFHYVMTKYASHVTTKILDVNLMTKLQNISLPILTNFKTLTNLGF